MSISDGLRSLKVSITGHVCLNICFGDINQYIDKVIQKLNDLAGFIDHVQTLVQSYLVITRTSCVKALAGISDTVGKLFFDKHMDIFGI